MKVGTIREADASRKCKNDQALQAISDEMDRIDDQFDDMHPLDHVRVQISRNEEREFPTT